jgi:curved DNA-binding protein CbpA
MNFYSVLEVGKLSSPLEIRQSYKRLSRQYHPDKTTATNAEETFARIKHSYDVSNVLLI